ncbi:hypothetical protein [Flaviaesturariibacter terrae]
MKLKHRSKLALPVLFFLLLLSACRREESLESGFTAAYSLQDTFGTCFGSQVVGTYYAGQPLGDSNYLQISLYVTVPGRYSINTDVQNGFSFTGTGTFADTGMTSIRVPARGTPTAEGMTTLRIARDSSFCEINVLVVATVPGNGGGSCNASVTGTFKKDSALTSAHTVTLQHNYSATGSYIVSTDTINGYYFAKTLTITSVGNQSISLDGFGTPAALGTNNFTVHFGDGTTCGFPVTVIAGTGGGGGGGCGTVNGAYTVGTAMTAANTFTSNAHTYTATGSYTVRVTPTAPGLSASTATVTVTTAGSTPSISVPLSGTPTTAGSFAVNIDFGDGSTCSTSMTVLPSGTTPSGDYFPVSANSYWTYNDPGGDTVVVRNDASGTLGNGQTYRFFRFSDASGVYDTAYFRKETGIAYQGADANKLFDGTNLVFAAGTVLEMPIVKNSLSANETWYSNAYNATVGGAPVQVRVVFKCVTNNASLSLNGQTFNNVYQVSSGFEWNPGTGWQAFPSSPDYRTQWFAPGVGIIQEAFPMTTPLTIRFYQVL